MYSFPLTSHALALLVWVSATYFAFQYYDISPDKEQILRQHSCRSHLLLLVSLR
jgi:hypothetical protein